MRRRTRGHRRAWLARAMLVVAVLLGLVVAAGCGGGERSTVEQVRQSTAPIGRPDVGFRSQTRLREHYEKHGREFGSITIDDYLRMAQTLRDRPVGGDVLEVIRRVGRVTRFDRSSGAFIAFDSDAIIRTFFRPNDGEAYFRRQAKR